MKESHDLQTQLEMELEELQDLQTELKNKVIKLQSDIDNFELDSDDYEEQYCNSLDEETIFIGNIEFNPSDVLRELDPIAYRCGLNDYTDGVDVTHDSQYIELENELEEIECELESVEEQIEELENKLEGIKEEIEELENE